MDEIIHTSFFDDDAYKQSMANAIWLNYPNATASYRWTCRSGEKLGFLVDRIKYQISALSGLSPTTKEIDFLKSLGWYHEGYLEWLANFRLNPSVVNVEDYKGELIIEVGSGKDKWLDTEPWEIKLLSIVSELWFNERIKDGFDRNSVIGHGERRLMQKIERFKACPQLQFADFGTRRRAAGFWQDYVVLELDKALGSRRKDGRPKQFVGTSNLHLAMKYGIKPIGTMAHEWIMAHLALVDRLETAQCRALHVWLQTFKDRLGIALTDTFTTEAFWRDFAPILAKSFDGIRHDSGDPYAFCRRAIEFYKSVGIDPKSKTVVFSDGLDDKLAIDLWLTFAGQIGISFGIGTFLTFDFGIVKALQIVIKMWELNGKHVIKLSDNKAKNMGDQDMVEAVKKAFQVS